MRASGVLDLRVSGDLDLSGSGDLDLGAGFGFRSRVCNFLRFLSHVFVYGPLMNCLLDMDGNCDVQHNCPIWNKGVMILEASQAIGLVLWD